MSRANEGFPTAFCARPSAATAFERFAGLVLEQLQRTESTPVRCRRPPTPSLIRFRSAGSRFSALVKVISASSSLPSSMSWAPRSSEVLICSSDMRFFTEGLRATALAKAASASLSLPLRMRYVPRSIYAPTKCLFGPFARQTDRAAPPWRTRSSHRRHCPYR